MFAINSSSGWLYVNGDVDREHPALIASDGLLYIIVKVCLSVCPLAYRKPRTYFYKILYTCCLWPWLGPVLMKTQYVIYFSCVDLERVEPAPPPPPWAADARRHCTPEADN